MNKHGSWETDGISSKLPIYCDTIKAFKLRTSREDCLAMKVVEEWLPRF